MAMGRSLDEWLQENWLDFWTLKFHHLGPIETKSAGNTLIDNEPFNATQPDKTWERRVGCCLVSWEHTKVDVQVTSSSSSNAHDSGWDWPKVRWNLPHLCIKVSLINQSDRKKKLAVISTPSAADGRWVKVYGIVVGPRRKVERSPLRSVLGWSWQRLEE